MSLQLDGIAVQDAGGGADAYAAAVAAARRSRARPAARPDERRRGGDRRGPGRGRRRRASARHAATPANWQEMAEVAKKHGCPSPCAPRRRPLDARRAHARRCAAPAWRTSSSIPAEHPRERPRGLHAAAPPGLEEGRAGPRLPLFACAGTDVEAELARATQAIAKYAGVVVLDHDAPGVLYALITLRQNIYTDPQKPIQVEPKLYEIGAADPASPLLVTTNFSLTYFSVSGEVEGAGVPAWLLVADSDGQSVLTAWAAGKFDAEKIAKTVKDSGIADRIDHKKLVIPGHVAGLSGEVEEELPGWQIMVGPRDAVDIPNYLKNVWSA